MAGEIRLSTQALASSLVNSIIADSAVDSRTLAADAVLGSHVSAGVIVGSHVAADAIVGSHVSAGVIVGSHVAADAIVGSHVSAGVIVGSHIASATIAASNLNFAVAALAFNEIPAGTVNGTNQVYTMATAPTVYNVMPFVNGVKLKMAAAATANTSLAYFYMTATADTLYTIGAPPQAGDNVDVTYAH